MSPTRAALPIRERIYKRPPSTPQPSTLKVLSKVNLQFRLVHSLLVSQTKEENRKPGLNFY